MISKGILVEVNCETDFVAKNDDFVSLRLKLLVNYFDNPDIDLEAKRTEQVAKIGENIRISRSAILSPKSMDWWKSMFIQAEKLPFFFLLVNGLSESANSDMSQCIG